MKHILLTLLLLALTAVVSAQSGAAPEPRLSYIVCDWGLITIEESTGQPSSYIHITFPTDYSAVEGSTFTLSGTGAGLFEGNVIVEVVAEGDVPLFNGTTVLQTQEPGSAGDWSIDVDLGTLEQATRVVARVYSTSPEDGSTVAYDSLRLNANSSFGLPYVKLTNPTVGAGVSTNLLLVEGMAGAAFENNIVVEVKDAQTGETLASTPATIQTDELGGSGPFSVEVSFDAEPGTGITITASQPSVAVTDTGDMADYGYAIVNPLGRTYERLLMVRSDDPILGAKDVCAITRSEFENAHIQPLIINNVTVLATRSMMPLVQVSIDAAGSSNCPSPLRTRTVRTDDTYAIETYLDITQPAACTTDLSPIPLQVSLGTLPNPDFKVTVNGEVAG
ncbi:MAG: Gmad2 immunoglobulin-like domain-containing protein [Anaerolineae bacterium]